MSVVFGTALEAESRRWTPSLERRVLAIKPALRELATTGVFDEIGDRLTLIPDVHYPFHPSSGMVTDPAVVAALIEVLDADAITVAGVSDPHIDLERCWSYLGWEGISTSRVDLGTSPTTSGEVRLGDELVSVAVPEILLETSVVPVPTLRPTREGPVAGALRTLALGVGDGEPTDEVIAATTRLVDPVCTLLDSTVAFAGEPAATGALLAGDPVAVDAVAATVLELAPADDRAIALSCEEDRLSVSVSGIELADLRTALPSGSLPPATETHPIVPAAYRIYAATSGDAIPPQLER